MKRLPSLLAACMLAALLASCTKYGVFEDVGADPHPPGLTLLGIGLLPPEGDPANPPPVTFLPPATVITVRPGSGVIVLKLRYTDAGGDLVSLQVRDRDGDFSASAGPEAPPEPEPPVDGEAPPPVTLDFFPGTAGIVTWELSAIEGGQEGLHRLELWAEDSRESRSEKVEFAINVELF